MSDKLLEALGHLARRMEANQVIMSFGDHAPVRDAVAEITKLRGQVVFMQGWFASRLEKLRVLIESDALHIYNEAVEIMQAGQEGFASPPAFDKVANLEALLSVADNQRNRWEKLATEYKELADARGEAIEKFRDKKDRLDADAYRFYLLRNMLEQAGCPWPEDCHIPTVVGQWLERMHAASVRPLAPSKEA